jgi:cystathionine beta-lyase/cystathionine gamma-synthase
MDISYILNELGEERDKYFRAVAPPIIQTSNFAFQKVSDLREVVMDEYSGWLYSRGLNPTVDILRKKLAALDGAEDALVFNSGAAAIFASILANVKSGDHVVCVKNPYTWVQKMLEVILPRFNVTHAFVDGTDSSNFSKAVQPNTSLFYLETPNSWTYNIQNLEEISAIAKKAGILTICDNSYCTPLYQQPLKFGIDLVLQSATKYISGHSDVVAGVLSGSAERIKKIFHSEYMNIGSGMTPFNAWLLIRGLRTLPVRLKKISENTLSVVEFLKTHEAVEKVYFPFDKSFAQYDLAQKQMSGACGLLTFTLKKVSLASIEKFCESFKHILMAVSWGGHESLILPKCAGLTISSYDIENEEHRMIRMYVGLEEADYIINDLKQALDSITD